MKANNVEKYFSYQFAQCERILSDNQKFIDQAQGNVTTTPEQKRALQLQLSAALRSTEEIKQHIEFLTYVKSKIVATEKRNQYTLIIDERAHLPQFILSCFNIVQGINAVESIQLTNRTDAPAPQPNFKINLD